MPLITLQADESMITAMKLIKEKGIKRAALVKNGQLIGMLTEEIAKKAKLQVEAPTS
jgi:CBS domain-containing protein